MYCMVFLCNINRHKRNTNGVFVLKSDIPDQKQVEQKNDDNRQRQHVQLEIVDYDKVNLHIVSSTTCKPLFTYSGLYY